MLLNKKIATVGKRYLINKRMIIFIECMLLFFSLYSYAEEPSIPLPQPLDKEMDYIVKKGDTLWDISKRFYGDPFLWPRLWQQNQYVTNPHFIYPGDRIRLYPYKILIKEEEKPPPVEEAKPLLPPKLEEVPPLPPPPEVIRLVIYPEVGTAGFIADKMKGVGKIVAAKVDKIQLAAEDEVYIKFQKGFSVDKGDVFTIFRIGEWVKHPASGKVIGRKMMILGTTVITKTTEGKAQTALITRSYNPILKGDELTPYFAPREELDVRSIEKPLYGWVVASQLNKLELVEGDVVYIDRGEDDHVQPGNIFHVFRRGGVVRDPASKKKKETIQLPDETIARLVVIKTQPKTSTAVIVQTRLSVHVGDEITTVSE
jgi:hypothetical protein